MPANLTPISARYGAPMGRRNSPAHHAEGLRVYLHRVPLDSGGYDAGGAYWGIPDNLYQAAWDADDPSEPGGEWYTRAAWIDDAAAEFLRQCPDVRLRPLSLPARWRDMARTMAAHAATAAVWLGTDSEDTPLDQAGYSTDDLTAAARSFFYRESYKIAAQLTADDLDRIRAARITPEDLGHWSYMAAYGGGLDDDGKPGELPEDLRERLRRAFDAAPYVDGRLYITRRRLAWE